MNYPKGLDKSGIMFFSKSWAFFSRPNRTLNSFTRQDEKKKLWTKFLGQFGRIKPVDASLCLHRFLMPSLHPQGPAFLANESLRISPLLCFGSNHSSKVTFSCHPAKIFFSNSFKTPITHLYSSPVSQYKSHDEWFFDIVKSFHYCVDFQIHHYCMVFFPSQFVISTFLTPNNLCYQPSMINFIEFFTTLQLKEQSPEL